MKEPKGKIPNQKYKEDQSGPKNSSKSRVKVVWLEMPRQPNGWLIGDPLHSLRKQRRFEVAALESPCMLAQEGIRVCIQSIQMLAKVEEGWTWEPSKASVHLAFQMCQAMRLAIISQEVSTEALALLKGAGGTTSKGQTYTSCPCTNRSQERSCLS